MKGVEAMSKQYEPDGRRTRGRPRTYQYDERRRIADVIRQYGARGAQRQLGGAICISTLLAIAREFGIELKKGRRRVA